MSVFDRMSAKEAEIYIHTKFVTSLAGYYEDECSFLQSLVDCLRRTAMRESLSDNQKYLVSLDKPFNSNVSDQNISQRIDSDEQVDLLEIQSEINANFNEDSTSELKSVVDYHDQHQIATENQVNLDDDIQRQIQDNKKKKKKRRKNKAQNVELAKESKQIIIGMLEQFGMEVNDF